MIRFTLHDLRVGIQIIRVSRIISGIDITLTGDQKRGRGL